MEDETTEEGQTCEEPSLEELSLERRCGMARDGLKYTGMHIFGWMKDARFKGEEAYSGQHSEMKANIMLTYRHIEDARMRIGKILQAADDGVSILDKPPIANP